VSGMGRKLSVELPDSGRSSAQTAGHQSTRDAALLKAASSPPKER
jgi:hypothetical protein